MTHPKKPLTQWGRRSSEAAPSALTPKGIVSALQVGAVHEAARISRYVRRCSSDVTGRSARAAARPRAAHRGALGRRIRRSGMAGPWSLLRATRDVPIVFANVTMPANPFVSSTTQAPLNREWPLYRNAPAAPMSAHSYPNFSPGFLGAASAWPAAARG